MCDVDTIIIFSDAMCIHNNNGLVWEGMYKFVLFLDFVFIFTYRNGLCVEGSNQSSNREG